MSMHAILFGSTKIRRQEEERRRHKGGEREELGRRKGGIDGESVNEQDRLNRLSFS